MDVKLNGFHSGAVSGIFDVNTYMRIAFGANLRRVNAKVAVLKLRIAQSVSERVERRAGHVNVPSLMLRPTTADPIGLRWFVIVIDRQLSRAARNGDGQTAAGVRIAEDHISHRFASC